MGNLISLGDWANSNGMDPATARQRAGRGAFKTAQKIGRNWVIDEDEKLVDHRKAEKHITLKKAIMNMVNSDEGEVRLNNVSTLRRWTKNALDMDVDELKLYFDNINSVYFGIYDTTIKSRDYDGIIKECCTLTEKFFAEVSRSLCNDLKAGYRNRTF